jgi:hypothetical protein
MVRTVTPLATTASRWRRNVSGVTANGLMTGGGSADVAWYRRIGTGPTRHPRYATL